MLIEILQKKIDAGWKFHWYFGLLALFPPDWDGEVGIPCNQIPSVMIPNGALESGLPLEVTGNEDLAMFTIAPKEWRRNAMVGRTVTLLLPVEKS